MSIKHIGLTVVFLLAFCSAGHSAELKNDNFNSYSTFSQVSANWTYTDATRQSLVTGSECRGGSGGCIKISWTSGVDTNSFKFTLPASERLVHVRFSFKQTGSLNYRSKFLKIFGDDSATGYANVTFNNGYTGSYYDGVSSGDGESTINDTNTVGLYGSSTYPKPGTVLLHSSAYEITANWQTFEAIVYQNSNDNYDGYIRMWINGVERYHVSGIKIRHNSNALGFKDVSFGNWSQGFSEDFDFMIDDVVITSDATYIGTPPSSALTQFNQAGIGQFNQAGTGQFNQ